MTQEELAEMVAAEEKRLGIGSSDFMERQKSWSWPIRFSL